jgi:hypothetical protein
MATRVAAVASMWARTSGSVVSSTPTAPPQAGLMVPTSGRPESCSTIHPGWDIASSDVGAARNGASQIPGTRPALAMSAARVVRSLGKRSLVVSQSPSAASNPSSTWKTSNGQSADRVRLERTSSSLTPEKYWYQVHHPTV